MKVKKTKYIVRATLMGSMLIALIYINAKPAGKKSIAEFKLQMIEQIRKDSLDTAGKVEMVVNETSAFMEDSSSVKKTSQLLLGLLVVWAIVEVFFFIRPKQDSVQE